MNVLVADKFESWGIERLRQAGFTVTCEPDLKGDTLRDAVARTRCAVLIVRSTEVTESIIAAGPELSLVVRAGAGVNTIDVAAASRRSVFVANCPGKNAVAVAELTFGLILSLDRRIVENVNDLRKGVWNKKEYSQSRGLKGQTLGIVGLGQIGSAVAQRAKAFEMKVLAWSRSLTPDKAEGLGVGWCATPADLAAKSDILTVHLSASPETRKLINASVIDRLPKGAYLINTARADVMDFEAVARAVKQQGLRVGLDVFPEEPAGGQAVFAAPIMQAEGIIYGTHHVGASTDQAQDAIAEETVRIVQTFRDAGRVLNCVNLRSKVKARSGLRIRHLNRPGVLAHVLHEVSHAGINVEEMENVICQGDESACAQILLERPLPEDVVAQILRGNPNILGVTQTDLPA